MSRRVEIGRYLVSDPKICHGQLTFKGTRVLVRSVLRAFQRGESWEDIRRGWPTVSPEAIREALTLATGKLVKPLQATNHKQAPDLIETPAIITLDELRG